MNPNHSRTRPRRGYTLIELAVSLLVVMAAMGVSVKVLGWVATERRAADRRDWALQTVSNVLERVTSGPFDRATAGEVKALAAATAAGRSLPGAAWEVAVEDEPGAPAPARRVSLQLRWNERAGGLGAPVRLTAWVYRRGPSR